MILQKLGDLNYALAVKFLFRQCFQKLLNSPGVPLKITRAQNMEFSFVILFQQKDLITAENCPCLAHETGIAGFSTRQTTPTHRESSLLSPPASLLKPNLLI